MKVHFIRSGERRHGMRIDAARRRVFTDFDRLAAEWRALRVGEALVLEWPTLRRVDHPIG